MKHVFALFFAVLLTPLAALQAAEEPANKPNILILLADDLGWADVGFNGSKEIPTPHLDSLARNGVRSSAGYVTAPQCSPTRAGLLTGRYQQRFGHDNNNYNLACFHTGQRIFPSTSRRRATRPGWWANGTSAWPPRITRSSMGSMNSTASRAAGTPTSTSAGRIRRIPS